MINKPQSGFTLIELIMTIVLLGVLAAVAIPRFADISSEADTAVFETIKANFKTAVNLVHSKSLIYKTSSGFLDVSLEGTCINVDAVSGYPLVDQGSDTCTPIASLTPLQYHPLPDSLFTQMIAHLNRSSFFVATAHASPPPPPPPPPPSTTDLPNLLMDFDFDNWIWTETVPTATLTAPSGQSFIYNQSSGLVN